MKKLIFGLILSVGVSGVALANTDVVVKQNQLTEAMKIENWQTHEIKPMGCAESSMYKVVHCDGTWYNYSQPIVSIPCGGMADGTFYIVVLPVQYDACD